MRVFSAYACAVLATYVLAAIAATQWVLGSLTQMGYEVSVSDRLATTAADLVGMLPTFGLLIAVAMAVALPVAVGVAKFVPSLRGFGLVAAGVLAVIGMHLIMKQVLDITPVAAARGLGGLLAQGIAGGVGGYIYHLMRSR